MKTLQGPTLEQPAPAALNPLERIHGGAGHKELQPMGRTHVGEVYGDCPPREGPVLEQGKSVRSAPHEEEGGAAFIPCLLCHWQVRGREPGLW